MLFEAIIICLCHALIKIYLINILFILAFTIYFKIIIVVGGDAYKTPINIITINILV